MSRSNMAELGRRGGSATSAAKRKAARRNARKPRPGSQRKAVIPTVFETVTKKQAEKMGARPLTDPFQEHEHERFWLAIAEHRVKGMHVIRVKLGRKPFPAEIWRVDMPESLTLEDVRMRQFEARIG